MVDHADQIRRLEAATGPLNHENALTLASAIGATLPGMSGATIYDALRGSLDAAVALVPEGWIWLSSNRAPKPHAGRAYISNGEMISISGGMTPNPRYRGQEVTAPTPALALVIAALRARQGG